ncbi:hypothetical protein HAX54_003728, partial [Datura stramonium]|nr:hypothetical protein [Datura stramonium]
DDECRIMVTLPKESCRLVYDDTYYVNQGWSNVQFVDTSSQGSTKVLPPHMESTLEVVLEKVLANEEGVKDLQSKLLDLTTMVKSHE